MGRLGFCLTVLNCFLILKCNLGSASNSEIISDCVLNFNNCGLSEVSRTSSENALSEEPTSYSPSDVLPDSVTEFQSEKQLTDVITSNYRISCNTTLTCDSNDDVNINNSDPDTNVLESSTVTESSSVAAEKSTIKTVENDFDDTIPHDYETTESQIENAGISSRRHSDVSIEEEIDFLEEPSTPDKFVFLGDNISEASSDVSSKYDYFDQTTESKEYENVTNTLENHSELYENTDIALESKSEQYENETNTLESYSKEYENATNTLESQSDLYENTDIALESKSEQYENETNTLESYSKEYENATNTLESQSDLYENTDIALESKSEQYENETNTLESYSKEYENATNTLESQSDLYENTDIPLESYFEEYENITNTLESYSEGYVNITNTLESFSERYENVTNTLEIYSEGYEHVNSNYEILTSDEMQDQPANHHSRNNVLDVVNIMSLNADKLVKKMVNENKKLQQNSTLQENKRRESSLAFVFDATGSMYDDLVQLREGAELILEAMLEREDNPIHNFVLVPYRDPDIGRVVVTSDHDLFKEELSNIEIYGGGDCPESSLSGIKAALNVSLPYSYVYVFTDATATDYGLVDDVISAVQQKQSQVVFILTGFCQNKTTPHYKVYEQIASASSGQIFHLEKSDIKQILSYVKESLVSDLVNLNSFVNPPGNHTHKLAVDESLKKVTISVSGHNPRVAFTNPSGELVDGPPKIEPLVNLADVQVINLINPEPGNWTLTIGSPEEHSVKLTGLSNLTFLHGFSVSDPQHMDNTMTRPLQGTQNYLMISISNNTGLDTLTSAELVNISGNTLYEIPLARIDEDKDNMLLYKSDPILPPKDLFNVAINGLDKNGNVFRRISTTGVKADDPEKPRVTVIPEITGEYHDQITLRCSIKSLVPISVWLFRKGHPLIPKQDHIQSAIVEYTISDLTEETEGAYICKASNIAGHSVGHTNVALVGQPPEIELTPRNLTERPDVTITLQCSVESKLPVSVNMFFKRFTHNDADSMETISKEIVETHHGSRIYTYSFVLNKETQGVYTCQVSNQVGTVQKETTIKLKIPMKVKVLPKVLEFQEGGSLGFSCIIKEGFSGKWSKQNNDILERLEDNTADWEISEVKIKEKREIQIFLDIKNPTKKHEGYYECHGFRDDESAYDAVEARYVEAPAIHMKHNRLLFELDSMAVIDCEASGIPQPFIFWYGLDEVQIIPDNGIMKRVDVNKQSQLVIHNINPIDNGKYVCEAENQFGKVKKDLELTVFQKPYFTLVSENQNVNIYSSLVLTCMAAGIPKPNITWYFNNMPYNDVELLADSGVDLHIKNIEMKHNGNYSCIAENEYDIIKENVLIKVVGLESPVVYKGNKTVVLNEGDPYNFVCGFVHGKPYPKLFWEKDGEKIWEFLSDFGSEDNDEGDGSNLEFKINQIMREQEGNYSCIGRNAVGEDRYDFTLEVHTPPKLVSFAKTHEDDYDYDGVELIIKPLEVVAGEDITLNCAVEGKPRPLITWSKDGIPVVYTNNVHMDSNSTLVMTQVKETDGGHYTCFASNPSGSLVKNFTMNVLVPPAITNESVIEPVINTVEGQLVLLPCSVYAIPMPEVVWLHNNEAVSISNRMQLDSDNTLRFVANLTDAGVYRCEAFNKIGNASKEYLVLVFVPPYIYPSGNEVIKTKENMPTMLECNAVGFPVPTIRWIKNGQILSNASGEFVFDNSGKLNVTKSSKNTTGIYVCEAENLAGLTEKLFHIIMNEAPNILPSEVPSNIELLAGEEEYNIPCKASGNPTPYTTWLRDGKYIVNNLHIKVQTDGTLSLRLVTEELNGKYTCQAANAEGSLEIDYNVRVIAPPVLLESDENNKTIIAVENSNVTLECPLRPTQILPNIQWYKKSDLIDQTVSSSKLILTNVTRSDASEYSCFASNAGGRVSTIFNLIVQWPPIFLPNISGSDENLHFLEGEPMKLACHVDANPAADVQWLKDLEIVGDVSPILKRNFIKTHHAGEHFCIASNPLGQIKKKFFVHVSVPPTIEGPLNVEMEVRLGQPVRLECYTNGYPKPHIEWITKHLPDWDIIGDGRILKAFNISIDSEGMYSCKATNKAGQAEKFFNVTVLEPPKIPAILVNESKLETSAILLESGSNTTISCLSSGQPASTAMWIRNGMILNKESITTRKTNLLLNNAQIQDSGMYTCFTKNKVGSEEFDITVEVLVPAEIQNDMTDDMYVVQKNITKQKWRKIEVSELQPVKLHCRTFGNPSPDIYWFKDNKYLGFYDSNMITKDHGKELIIQKVSREHRGNYTCVARNKVGEDKLYFNLDVWVSPFVDQQKDGSQEYVAKRGQSVYLECPVMSNPLPKIRWLKTPFTEIVGSDKNMHYQFKDKNSTLIIHNVTVSDNGNYSCIGTNIAGMVEITFSVEVVEAPMFVVNDQDLKKPNVYPNGTITTKIRRGFQLTCNAVAHPEPDILWYKDGFKLHKTFVGDSFHISSDGRYLNVMDAQLKHAGKYTCVVYNKVGSIEKDFDVKVLVPAEWGMWSQWSECSESCGTGVSSRVRECQFHGDLEAVGGLQLRVLHHSFEDTDSKNLKIAEEFLDKSACRGNSTEHKECFIIPCIIDGGWSSWGNWTSCSVLCGPGSRRRYRTCSSPKPQHGGKPCVGADAQQEPCSGRNCALWLPWSSWSPCTVTCGMGVQSRIRICEGPTDSCPGSSVEHIPCKLADCPGKWSDWSPWGACSVTCGNGIRKRYRECLGTNCTGGNLQIERCRNVPLCNKYDRRYTSQRQLFVPSDKSIRTKGVEYFGKNGKNSITPLKKDEHLPSATFVVAPTVVGEQKNDKNPMPASKMKKSDFDYDGDIETLDFQLPTGDKNKYYKNFDKTNEDFVNVDVIFDGNVSSYGNSYKDDHLDHSYFQSSDDQPSNMMLSPTLSVNTCTAGYIYDYETNRCQDINECHDQQNACHSTQLCENLLGSYRCFCQRGYMSMGMGQRCLDVNECLQNVHECSHECVNMAGSYKCACPVGYKLTTDNKTCVHDESQETSQFYFPLKFTKTFNTESTFKITPSTQTPIVNHYDSSSEDESILLTRISPKGDKPQRKRRPHKHTFENDYDYYDSYKSKKDSLLPIDDEEYADVNEEGRQRISKQTIWDIVTELANDEDKDVYVSHESVKTESPLLIADKIKSFFNFNKELHTEEITTKSVATLKMKSGQSNRKVTVIGKQSEDHKKEDLSDEDSYEDGEDSIMFEDSCPDGHHHDNGVCVDIDECNMQMNTCNGVTDACINTKGSYICVPTPCPEKYKRNNVGVCEQNCEERDTVCSQGAALTQSVIYIIVTIAVKETKVPGAIISLQYGGIKNHTSYSLERQPKGETFYVTTDEKMGTIHTLMSPTFKRVNRIIVSGRTLDETERKLLHYTKFVIYLYILD